MNRVKSGCIHEGKKPFKCDTKRPLKVGSLNIGRGLFKKEELLINTIKENDFDIFSTSEVDIKNFDEDKPFTYEGYKTFHPIQRPGTSTKRLLCFVKNNLEVIQRNDLMSNLLSNVWLQVNGVKQKVLICTIYREFSDLTSKGQMTIEQQLERWKILHSQVEKASKEGLILIVGDMNIDLQKLEESTYYLKKLAEEHLSMIGECGLEVLNFGITWSRTHKDGTITKSAIDQALTNKPLALHSYHKKPIDYSDHSMICINMDLSMKSNSRAQTTTYRDLRKLRSNPQFFLNSLSKIDWSLLANFEDVDEMETFWTSEIKKCLDFTAPWKTGKNKQKRYCLPKEIQEEIKKRRVLQNRHKMNIDKGKVNLKLQKQLKKHNNYCNKLIKKAVREKNGKNITDVSSGKEIWKCINDILRPEKLIKNKIKIEIENQSFEDPEELAEKFNKFFKEKVEKLASGIRKNPKNDSFSKLREKLKNSNQTFSLKTVCEKDVLKILKSLKPKRSYGLDGITSEILKLGAEVLVVPLTFNINSSIVTGKFPSNWKVAKVVPLHKKGDRKALQNYRPVALLCTPGMILERVIALQIEKFFENNELFGKFQFGFRNKKSTISEMLTVFDSLLEAKDMEKEILVVLYDLSSAFDTVSHEILLTNLKIYGFNEHSIKWVKSYLENRKQMVTICGQLSSTQDIEIGTPQGSRLSQLLFVCLMADMNLWTEKSKLSNFADDT